MEEELSIKMKKVVISVSALIVSALTILMLYLSLQTVNIQPTKVLITGGNSGYLNLPCILEVTSDGQLKATTGTVSLESNDGTLNSETYFSEGKKTRSKRLTKKDRKEIERLIEEVKRNCDPGNLYALYTVDTLIVYAMIDGEEYVSLYEDTWVNKQAGELARKLVELSPIDVMKKVY